MFLDYVVEMKHRWGSRVVSFSKICKRRRFLV